MDELEAVYRATNYWVDDAPDGPFIIRIGQACAELAEVLFDECEFDWAYVTACNPHSQPLPAEINVERMRSLEERIRRNGWKYYRGRGVSPDGRWEEPSFLIIGIGETSAVTLARQFQQNALLVGGDDGEARLVWVR